MAVRIRKLTGKEHEQIRRLSQSRTAPAQQFERTRVLQLASQGYFVPTIAAQLQMGQDVVRLSLKRFNAVGPAGPGLVAWCNYLHHIRDHASA